MTKIPKCQICKHDVAEWVWQPFGPELDMSQAFTLLGCHYRGYAMVKVCDPCKESIQLMPDVEVAVKIKDHYYLITPQPREVINLSKEATLCSPIEMR
jgi:hypothetical protein